MAIPLTGSAEDTVVSSLFCHAVCNDFINLRCTCLAFLCLSPAYWPFGQRTTVFLGSTGLCGWGATSALCKVAGMFFGLDDTLPRGDLGKCDSGMLPI